MEERKLEKMTIGGGCFWCTEAIFDQIKGVEEVISGYSGGNAPGTPTYREVCSGLTGHAEVIQVTYDPKVITYRDLLTIFMTSHDPTTLNRQGGDMGTQYRSVIFYHDGRQRKEAENVLAEMAQHYDDPIVTEVAPLEKFFPAEVEHQEYYANNPSQGYCSMVIAPKLAKLRQAHADKLKGS